MSKNQSMQGSSQSLANSTLAAVLALFAQLNKLSTPSKSLIFQLTRQFKLDPKGFSNAWDQGYLKVWKALKEKGTKKIPNRYEEMAQAFFRELLSKQEIEEDTVKLLNRFICLLAEGIYSTVMNIRIMTARMAFMILKLLPPTSSLLNSSTIAALSKAIYFLLRMKVSTYKQLAIKLSSLLSLHPAAPTLPFIHAQLFKLLALDENEQIRKMAMVNLPLDNSNLSRMLQRLRDKCPEIRIVVVRKIAAERLPLQALGVGRLYKLLYDGYGNKDIIVKKETIKYFAMYFDVQSSSMEIEPSYSKFSSFLQLFNPNILLLAPHLYYLFDNLIGDIMLQLQNPLIFSYLRHLLLQIKQTAKGNSHEIGIELIWLKNAAKSEMSEMSRLVQGEGPSGVQMAVVLKQIVRRRDVFGIYEFLQLFALMRTPDQIGRNKMFDALTSTLIELEGFPVALDADCIPQPSDIFTLPSSQQLYLKSLLLSYFSLPILSNSLDLISSLATAMRALRPDHYELDLKQIVAEWNNPQENTLQKQKEMMINNLKKIEGESGKESMVELMKQKLRAIEDRIQRQKAKTKMILLAISRLNPKASLEEYMPIIKDQLNKPDQSYGLLLLGLYSLSSLEKSQTFFPLFLSHVFQHDSPLSSLLISLKVLPDLIIKHDLLRIDWDMGEGMNNEVVLKKWKELIVKGQGQVRVMAIQGLCRMIYHGRIQSSCVGECFLYLLLLWWQTSSEEASAKSVHIISLFIKSYIEQSQTSLMHLSETFCIFFSLLLRLHRQSFVINKNMIVYNLKMEEFIKKTVVIAATVLKYKKDNGKVVWKYSGEAGFGPQEMFLLYILKLEGLEGILDRVISICDFYQSAPLETLIFVKKSIEQFSESISISKKFEQTISRFQTTLEETISIKQQSTFNEQILKSLESEFNERCKLIQEEAKRMRKNVEEDSIFVLQQLSESANPNQSQQEIESVGDSQIQFGSQQLSKRLHEQKRMQEMRKRPTPELGPIRKNQQRKKIPIIVQEQEPHPPKSSQVKQEINPLLSLRTRSKHKV